LLADQFFSQSFRQDAGSTLGQKKAPTHEEKGRQIFCALLIFPGRARVQAGIGTCIEIETSTGCRGFIGPVPSTTLHEIRYINECGYIDISNGNCQNFF